MVLMLDVLARVAERLPRPADRATLLGHAQAIRDDAVAAAQNPRDRSDIEKAFELAQRALTKDNQRDR